MNTISEEFVNDITAVNHNFIYQTTWFFESILVLPFPWMKMNMRAYTILVENSPLLVVLSEWRKNYTRNRFNDLNLRLIDGGRL